MFLELRVRKGREGMISYGCGIIQLGREIWSIRYGYRGWGLGLMV